MYGFADSPQRKNRKKTLLQIRLPTLPSTRRVETPH